MSAAVGVAAVAGALAGVGVGGLGPELAEGTRRAAGRLRRTAPLAVERLDRIVPTTVGLGLLSLALGAPALGAVVGIGPAVLRAVVRARRARRRRTLAHGAPTIARGLADALDAGHGVGRAIADAARATGLHGPAVDELRRVAAGLAAGEPLPGALSAWRRRADEPAHTAIVAALLLHGEAGGELSDVLREQADALERARRSAAEAESAIVQARAAARIVGGIPAASMGVAVLIAPGTVRQVTASLLGTTLVVTAVLLQVLAMVAVRRLTVGLGG